MSRYHEKTLELLGNEVEIRKNNASKLIVWAEENNIEIPSAFLEWEQLNGEKILSKYSNDNWFSFNNPKIITTDEGIRGLRFQTENQGNFEKIVQLDCGDNPPVLTAWCGDSPWIVNAEKFSDCVFAQIFDWQYLLEFDTNNPDYKEIGYYATLKLNSVEGLDYLRRNFTELASTKMIVEDEIYTEYRFCRSLTERITVFCAEDDSADIQITGEAKLVTALKNELSQKNHFFK